MQARIDAAGNPAMPDIGRGRSGNQAQKKLKSDQKYQKKWLKSQKKWLKSEQKVTKVESIQLIFIVSHGK